MKRTFLDKYLQSDSVPVLSETAFPYPKALSILHLAQSVILHRKHYLEIYLWFLRNHPNVLRMEDGNAFQRTFNNISLWFVKRIFFGQPGLLILA